jgi:hypothetical protein
MQANGIKNDQNQWFYRDAIAALQDTGVPFLVGGAFALESYTGLARRTKDLDVFVMPGDVDRLLSALKSSGYETTTRFPHWLGKAFKDGHFIDVIFNSGNGVCQVDEQWFDHAVPADVFGMRVEVIPPEEMIWSKAFIMERERFDGADIAHLFRAKAATMDWARLLSRFHPHWRILFAHLVLFGFIYPGHRLQIPSWLMNELMRRLGLEMSTLPPHPQVCQGTLLSWSQYLVHTDRGDYEDARHIPRGTLTPQETRHVTSVLTDDPERSTIAGTPFKQADPIRVAAKREKRPCAPK